MVSVIKGKKKERIFGTPDAFWEKWLSLDNAGRERLVECLGMFDVIDNDRNRKLFAKKVNSCFTDLLMYMGKRLYESRRNQRYEEVSQLQP